MHGLDAFNNMRPPKLQKNSPKIYCRFGSKQSRQDFHLERARPRKLSLQRRTIETQFNNSRQQSLSPIKVNITLEDTLQNDQTLKQTQQMQCIKCRKVLLEEQLGNGLCETCQKMEQYIKKGNFQKFVLFVFDFKKGTVPSYTKETKLRRVGSIESILSVTLDKAGQSGLKNTQRSQQLKFPPTLPRKPLSSSSQRFGAISSSIKISKKLPRNPENLHQSTFLGGYFCNQCHVEPIKGRRYHCIMCSDFDLCQKCYFYIGHKHQMQINIDSKEQQIKKLYNSVSKNGPSLSGLRQSIELIQKSPKLFGTHQFKRAPIHYK